MPISDLSMIKKYLFLLALVVLIGVYLNFGYAHFYRTIGQEVAPESKYPITVTDDEMVTTERPLKYVALGDSLTAGVGASAVSTTYPYQLAARVAEKQQRPVTLVNLGVPGAAAEDVFLNQVPQVLAFAPDIVTLFVGVNDLHQRTPLPIFEARVKAIVRAVQSTSTRVYVIRLPYLGSSRAVWLPYQWYFAHETTVYNQALDRALAGEAVTVIDLYAPTASLGYTHSDYYSSDGFHPSDIGYALWGTLLYDHLNF